MKKRVLSIILAMSVMTAAFTGCGAGAVEESSAASTEVSAEESSEESSAESTESVAEASTEANAEVIDWTTAYETYFDEHEIMRDNSQMSTTVTQEGVTMGMVTARSGENFYMSFDFDTMGIDMYVVEEKLYAKVYMDSESEWVYAPIESEEDTDSIKGMNSASVDDDSIVSWTYREEVTEGDVVYDVLDVTYENNDSETETMVCYVNRETQEIDKNVIMQDDVEVVLIVEDIEGINIPTEAAGATETTVEEIGKGLVGVIMMAAVANMETAQ